MRRVCGFVLLIFIIFDVFNCAPLEPNEIAEPNSPPDDVTNPITNEINSESRKAKQGASSTEKSPFAPVQEMFSNATNNVQQFFQGLTGNNTNPFGGNGMGLPFDFEGSLDLTPVMILGTYQALKMPLKLPPPLANVITGLGNAGTTLNNAGNLAGGAAGILAGKK